MPFFPMQSSDQIKDYCQRQSLEELKKLNQQYGVFFEQVGSQQDDNNKNIDTINNKINCIKKRIEENRQEVRLAEERRKNILENLPGNHAERYLALQATIYFPNAEDISEELKTLEKQKNELEQRNAWIKFEIHSCVQELKIVNAVIKEKEFATAQKYKILDSTFPPNLGR
ncbi:Uncharacterised protein [Legionella lansingensis]|uniref:Uncharacterized protein n=1 Tax=Legionella lansingensis TaxID=45067 RepID=A0A0W0VZA3_9GAMM|nr:hypothetical protein [Legionella lansingensis]KTD25416.1 hypothetical protein Llan_0162 [Legionella lansingensis]SNV51405.1 Uncharacterised protein [Legionella lansingensis]